MNDTKNQAIYNSKAPRISPICLMRFGGCRLPPATVVTFFYSQQKTYGIKEG